MKNKNIMNIEIDSKTIIEVADYLLETSRLENTDTSLIYKAEAQLLTEVINNG